jgi:hypothetical protein
MPCKHVYDRVTRKKIKMEYCHLDLQIFKCELNLLHHTFEIYVTRHLEKLSGCRFHPQMLKNN